MRIVYVLVAAACLTLVGCGDSNSGGQNDNGNVQLEYNDLSALVQQQCTRMPEGQDPFSINGLTFASGANNPNNQTFSNNCL